jgi:lysophospholipase L1-like esterase
VILIGTNNVSGVPLEGDRSADIENISRGIEAILKLVRKQAPEARVVLTGITPRNDKGGTALMPVIDGINERIAKFADGKQVRYVNINDKLADKDGKLFEGVTEDNLHLSVKGYQIWADALKPIFTEWLGPPAKEDHAPPPTGPPEIEN